VSKLHELRTHALTLFHQGRFEEALTHLGADRRQQQDPALTLLKGRIHQGSVGKAGPYTPSISALLNALGVGAHTADSGVNKRVA
jgi:hypothetical protein